MSTPAKRRGSGDESPPRKRARGEGWYAEEEEEEEIYDDEISCTPDFSQICTQDDDQAVAALAADYDAGILESLELVNFMCHKKLKVPLNRNVNFILGRNGSGKSAIMTAIVVGLGGLASITQRGSSLKEFIRSGSHKAVLKVRLLNEGPDSYQPGTYGSIIHVERTLKTDGVHSYAIKNSSGALVTTKKEDLVGILDHYNIQIDNPVSILNQDTSRNFLHSSNPMKKYKLFMKATHLEQVVNLYEQSKENQVAVKDIIKKKEEELPHVEQRAKHLEEQVKDFERVGNLEKKLTELEKELEWAIVYEIEKEILPIQSDINKEKGRIPRNEERLQSCADKLKAVKKEFKDLDKKLAEATKEVGQANQRKIAITAEKRARVKAFRELNTAIGRVSRQISGKKDEKKALQKRREDCIASSQRNKDGEKEEREGRLAGLEQQLCRVQEGIQRSEEARAGSEQSLKTALDELEKLRDEITRRRSDIEDAERDLQRLRSSRRNRLEAFGAWMPHLVSELAKQRFRRPVKGPIGSKVKLRDQRWALSVEEALGGWKTFSAFICDNHEDEATCKRVIRQVMRQHNGRGFPPDVITIPYSQAVYDCSRNVPDCRYPTVMQMVDIEDVDVTNVLIDTCGMESVLLIEKNSEARRVMDHQRPTKANRAYTLEGDQVQQGRFYSCKKDRSSGVLQANVEGDIKNREGVANSKRQELRDMEQRKDQLCGDSANLKRCKMEAHRKVIQGQEQKNKINSDISELKNIEEEADPQDDIATYDAEIDDCSAALRELEDKMEGMRGEVGEKGREVEGVAESEEAAGREVEEYKQQIEDLRSQFSAKEQTKINLEQKRQSWDNRLADIRTKIADLELKKQSIERSFEETRQNALRVCEPIQTTREPSSLRSEITQTRRRLEHEQPRLGDREQIEREYIAVMKEYDTIFDDIQHHKSLIQEMERSLSKRMDRYETLRNTIQVRSSLYFQSMLTQRGYEGKLRFNNEKEKLEIQVQVNPQEHSGRTKNTRALSGGERSFSTVCFIMSLWEAIEAPFRCLDEFDVFMDMLNRRISMNFMLQHAEDMANRQFIFFTPQDMSSMGIAGKRNVKVFKLTEPEQSTLD